MPHAALKLIPGVNQNETPALNQASVSSCNLIRYFYDPTGVGLVQKLGGWKTFYPSPTNTITRALLAWEDTNAATHLAAGNQANTSTLAAELDVITNGNLVNVTPRTATTNPSVNFATTGGSPNVIITDATFTASNYDSVYISTPVSVGGLVLFGFYPTIGLTSTTYEIQATDALGNLLNAPTTATGGAVPQFTTVSSSSVVTVTLANHGYSVGSTFPVLIPASFNGVVLSGNYTVQSVTSSSFTIQATTLASASSSVYLNNSNANFVYYIGTGPIPMGSGYGVGVYGRGGYGSGTAVVPSIGAAIYTNDWTLDNFGQILVACPVPALNIVLTTTAMSGNGTTATLTFAQNFTIPVGNVIQVASGSPVGYNGTYYVTASSPGSVSYANATTGAQTSPATITANDPASGPIFQWDPTSGNPFATVMTYAPPVNDGVFVAMPQRQIVAWGSTLTGVQDPLLIRWCDVQNYNQWIAQSTNQAGSFRLSKGSRIVGCLQGPQQALVWTDLAVWSMQYVGQPNVYSFNEIAVGCGLIGRKASGTFNGVVYWMGQSQFFQLSSGGVAPIPCPVWDVIFQQLDMTNVNKIRVAVNSRFAEVAWYYPTLTSGGEVAAYVKYNTVLNAWDFGALGRSAWINESVFGPPIGADPVTRYIFQHETSPDANGTVMNSWFQTGYFALQEGDMQAFVDQVWPDAKWGYYNGVQSATLNITFYVVDYPGATPEVYGPFSVTQATTYFNPRFRGRLVSIMIGGTDLGSWWRTGNLRYRIQPDGKY
jgi:hypothetical protein